MTAPPMAERVDRTLGIRERAEYLDGDRPIFAITHLPTSPPRAAAIVCPPLLATFTLHYPRDVAIGRALCAEGVAVTRFHHTGSGNSPGAFLDVGFEDLLADALAAAGHLAELAGLPPSFASGAQSGSLVAHSIGRALSVPNLILIEPTATGADYLRSVVRAELMRLMRVGVKSNRAEVLSGFDDRGWIELLGHPLGRKLYQDLERIDVTADPGAFSRALVVGFTPRSAPRKLIAELETSGTTVDAQTVAMSKNWFFYDEKTESVDALTESVRTWVSHSLNENGGSE